MHPFSIDMSQFLITTESLLVQCCFNVTLFFSFSLLSRVLPVSVYNCAKVVTRAYKALLSFDINISFPFSRRAEARIMRQQKSGQKDNCQVVPKHLKHVVHVSHRQKPYFDFSCSPSSLSLFFSLIFCNLKSAIFR